MGHGLVFAQEVHAAGVALAFVLEQVEGGLGERALVGLDVDLQLGAFEAVAAAVDQHVAAGLGVVGAAVEFELVGPDHGVMAAQFGRSFQHRDTVSLAFELFAVDK